MRQLTWGFMLFFLSFGLPVSGQVYTWLYMDYQQDNDEILSTFINYKTFYKSTLPDSLIEQNVAHYKIVKQNGRYGVFNETQNTYFAEPVYDSITKFGNALKNKTWSNLLYGDPIDDLVHKFPQGVVFLKGSKRGFKKISGEILLAAVYDEIIPKKYLKILLVRQGKAWGFTCIVNPEVSIKPKYDYITVEQGNNKEYEVVAAYKNKVKTLYSRWGTVLKENETPYDPKREILEFPEDPDDGEYAPPGLKLIKQNGKYGFADHNGKEIIAPVYTKIEYVDHGNFIVSSDTLRGIINRDGKIIVPVKYRYLTPIHKNYVYSGFYMGASPGENYSTLIDNKGTLFKEKIESVNQFSTIRSFNGNTSTWFLADTSMYKYENGTLEKVLTDDKVAFTDKNKGRIVVFKKYKDSLSGLFSIINNKRTLPLYKDIISLKSGNVAVKTGRYYDAVIDTLLNITPLPLPAISYKEGYFIVKDKELMRVMDEKGNVSAAAYPVIEPITDFKHITPFEEITTRWGRIFKYYTSADKTKPGVIDNTGKVIIAAGYYDDILALIADNDHDRKNKIIPEYLNRVIVCTRFKGTKDLEITLYLNDKKIAQYLTDQKKKFEYRDITRDGQILVRYGGRTKLYNLSTGDYDVEIDDLIYNQDADGGFTGKRKVSKYSKTGQLISEGWALKSESEWKNWENYISKKNKKFGLVNTEDKILIPFVNDTLFSIYNKYYTGKRNGKFGITDKTDKVLLPFVYDSIWHMATRGGTNHIMVMINGRQGVYNVTNLIEVVKPVHDKLTFSHNLSTIIGSNNNSSFTAYNTGQSRFYSSEPKKLFTLQCNKLEQEGNLFYFYRNGMQGIISREGIIYMEPLFTKALKYGNFFTAQIGKEIYVTNAAGKKLLPVAIQSVKEIKIENEGYYVKSLYTIKVYNGPEALFDENLKQIIPFQEKQIFDVYNGNTVGIGNTIADLNNKTIITGNYNISYDANGGYFEYQDETTTYKVAPNGVVLSKKPNIQEIDE